MNRVFLLTILIMLLIDPLAMVFNIRLIRVEESTYVGAIGNFDRSTAISTVDSWLADLNRRSLNVDSFAGNDWSFERAKEWADFACADEDSAELVIGLSGTQLDAYVELCYLITVNGGRVVNFVSNKDTIWAVIADVPFYFVSSLAYEIEASGLVRYIEPNFKVKPQFLPDDLGWSFQWGLQRIEADWAWNTTVGDASVIVAVIDTGINYDHLDLATNYVGLGYDWVNNDTDPMDDNGHGTHCAGIIAAGLNNAVGTAGLAQVKIMAEKALDVNGSGYSDDLANAIIHAANQGAMILSNSWGSYEDSALIHDAIKYAYDKGVLIVAAAGNDATFVKSYPAGYDEVMAVTATDQFDHAAWFTNFGDWIELAAPGVDIYSTSLYNGYDIRSGTSMACPHVSGVAALVWSCFPNMTRDQVRARLQYTADDLGDPGFDFYYGYGRVNARKAIEEFMNDHDLISGMETKPYVKPWIPVIFNATVSNYGICNEISLEVQLLINSSIVDSEFIDSLNPGASVNIDLLCPPLAEGTYNVSSLVVPVPGESLIQNNLFVQFVTVKQCIIVPDDYSTIREAVDGANTSETIFVRAGVYDEGVIVNKMIVLIGESPTNTIICGGIFGVTIKISTQNVTISGFMVGSLFQWPNGPLFRIAVNNALNTRIVGNIIVAAKGIGISATGSNISIINNIVQHSGLCGIRVNAGIDFAISGNIVSHSLQYGILLTGPRNCTLRSNHISDNEYNFGIADSYYTHDIDTSNTVNGKPIYYWVNRHDESVPNNAGYVALVNCTRIKVENLELTHNMESILLAGTKESTITKNKVMQNGYYGIYLTSSSNNTITGNTITAIVEKAGICLHNSSYNRIYHNNFDNDHQASLSDSFNNSWDDGYPSGGNYWSDYNGTDLFYGPYQNITGNDGIGDSPYVIDAYNLDNYPLMHQWPDTTPPILTILSPQNTTYFTTNVPLTYTVDEPISWIGYNLDSQGNITVTGNTTLTGLSNGSHYIILYANDTKGNMGYSDAHFTVDIAGSEWLLGWMYRKNHTIHHISGAGTNYQIRTVVHYGSGTDNDDDVYCSNHCKNDFGDIRFTSADGISLLDYWIEDKIDSDHAVFWVEISQDLSTEDRTICIYYGRSDAITTSNGFNTFELFDDFNGASLDLNIWDIILNEGTIEVTNGYLRMYRPINMRMNITSDNSFSGTKALRYRQKILQSNYYHSSVYYGTLPSISSIGYSLYPQYESALFTGDSEYPPRCGGSTSTDGDIIAAPPVGIWFTDEFYIPNGKISRSLNDGSRETSTRYDGVSSGNVGLWANAAWNTAMEHYTDWIFLRKYVEPEPSHGIWGSEEENHDVAVVEVKTAKNVVFQSYKLNINITVENQGNFTETFDVTVYANTTTIATFADISLTAYGDSETIQFTWNTSSFALGNYTISAVAEQVLGETDLNDNTCIDGEVMISKLGDLNLDGVINYKDASLFRQAYVGEYNYLADFNQDGVINYKDASLFRGYYIAG